MTPTRRAFVCSCAAAVALAAVPPAQAARLRAPRVCCAHTGCRHHRSAADGGRCALSLHFDAVATAVDVP